MEREIAKRKYNQTMSTKSARNQQKHLGPGRMPLPFLVTLLLTAATFVDCHQDGLHSISQISPKSSHHNHYVDISDLASSHDHNSGRLTLESTLTDFHIAQSSAENSLSNDDNETRATHIRIERSAMPVLNGKVQKSSPNDVHFVEEQQKEVAAGRYFQYNIKPTGAYGDSQSESPERTERVRAGKTLGSSMAPTASSSFLLKGDLRPPMSGSPINPTSSSAILATASATAIPQNGRQNPNPDIQDIITGIVKLLNGNVNVHANTQGVRRPTASRINNRGPPRISDAQTLPLDYEAQKPLGTSIRPPPYNGPFDHHERPFITGVPIPEQIVPYRPGFVSNRPPWHRNKPRPPISTTAVGGRRPILQYKPMPPATHMSPPPQDDPNASNAPPAQQDMGVVPNSDYHDTLDAAKPTDTTYDSEFSNEDINAQYIEVSDQDTDPVGEIDTDDDEPEDVVKPISPPKKDKKKPNKPKSSEKLKRPTIETTSSMSTQMEMTTSYLPMPMNIAEDVEVEPSEEVIFMTTSKTPALETSSSQHAYVKSSQSISSSPDNFSTTMATSTLPVKDVTTEFQSSISSSQDQTTIDPTPSTTAPLPTTTTSTTYTTTTSSKSESSPTNVIPKLPTPSTTPPPPQQYQPRPGIVLDDPEFKPGGRPRPPPRPQQSLEQPPHHHIQPTRQHLPPGYGEIFDVTLSAIQGPGSGSGSKQTINIKPFGSYGSGGNGLQPQADIIVSASGEDGFVSIDGKRTYINLFGDPTDVPAGPQMATTPATAIPQLPGSGKEPANNNVQNKVASIGAGYGVPETEVVELQPAKTISPLSKQPQMPTTNSGPTRPNYRPRTTQPPVRIDTCIVGDDSTCDQAQYEYCKTENGVSSCHCRPGYSRRKHREPCRKVISFYIGLRVDRIYEHRIVWDNKLLDYNSEPYGQLSYESVRAIDSAMSMTPYSDEFMEAKVNNIYRGDPNLGGSGVFVNLTIKLDESVETLRPNLRSDVQKHLLGVIHRRNNNIGNSVLYVTSPEGSISALHDLDECRSQELNDCHDSATCTNIWGSFRCVCENGYRDPWAAQPQRAGRDCQTCADSYCNNRGSCSFNEEGNQLCKCDIGHYGAQCEIDGEVLGVAIGASVAAVIIIVLTLVCLIMWSRRWQREQKNAMGSPVFGYMNTAPIKAAGLPQPGYQVTLEDRMRWAQIADVMAQTNHYGAEPIGPTRPSSAMFAYPNLQAMGMGTIGGMSMQSNMQMHQNSGMAPPVPLPRYSSRRLGLGSRLNGMRTLENSSSSEEEDRTDLLGRNFQVPRPKSRSNGSITNQSGIYYDVDYEPSGNGIGNTSVDHLYGSQNQSSSHSHTHSHSHGGGNSHMPGPQGIPMSTYTSGRATGGYYMK